LLLDWERAIFTQRLIFGSAFAARRTASAAGLDEAAVPEGESVVEREAVAEDDGVFEEDGLLVGLGEPLVSVEPVGDALADWLPLGILCAAGVLAPLASDLVRVDVCFAVALFVFGLGFVACVGFRAAGTVDDGAVEETRASVCMTLTPPPLRPNVVPPATLVFTLGDESAVRDVVAVGDAGSVSDGEEGEVDCVDEGLGVGFGASDGDGLDARVGSLSGSHDAPLPDAAASPATAA